MDVSLLVLKYLFYACNCLVAFYFLLPVVLFILHYLFKGNTGNNYISRYKKTTDKDFDFAAIITAHQDTRFIAPLVDSFFKQHYKKFTVYVVADDCDTSNISFTDNRIVLLTPPVALHSKTKSIQYAISNFTKEHDVLIIFDTDNLVHPNYLRNLNNYFQRGFRVVQTHMLSKNIENTYARLDSIGHIYYTFYERQVKMQLGLCSAILGLGVAIDYQLYKEIIYENVGSLGGFDKKLQSQLARKVKQIAFAEDAVVYDEKVEDGAVMEKQRTRWIFAYFSHFKESWLLTKAGFKNVNIGQILLGATMLRPPMILLILCTAVLILIAAFVKPVLVIWWAVVLILFVTNFILTVATQSRQKGMLQSIQHIPLLMLSQLKALLKIKKAKQDFLKTEHTKIIYIDELLKNELN
jgi:cellulose synthase/poly-beta-1,6-N-acetylglucosamine synthase-like glycosyltransferase